MIDLKISKTATKKKEEISSINKKIEKMQKAPLNNNQQTPGAPLPKYHGDVATGQIPASSIPSASKDFVDQLIPNIHKWNS